MQQAIKVAVDWWVERLQNRTLGTSGDGDIDMLFILAKRAPVPPLEQTKIEAFQSSLTRLLTECLGKFEHQTLSTDYGSQYMLEDALDEAGIHDAMTYLPMKTIMWIKSGEVSVKCGYGARQVVIYPKEQEHDSRNTVSGRA